MSEEIDGILLQRVGLLDSTGQLIEKGRVVRLVDVVHVPEPRLPNLLARTVVTEPSIRPGIERGFTVVAYERDGDLRTETLHDGNVYHSSTIFQLKAMLYHIGLLNERGTEAHRLDPTEDEW